MDLIDQKEKELKSLLREEAEKVVGDLVSKNGGETTLTLRRVTLAYLESNVTNEKLSSEIKNRIDEVINQIKIPTHSK